MNTQDQIDHADQRRGLGFVQAVDEYLGPLLKSHGFVCLETTPYSIRFRSSEVMLSIFHERLSFEIYVAISLHRVASQNFGLDEMLYSLSGPDHKQETFFQASACERVVQSIKAIVDILEKYGQGVLAGDHAVHSQIVETAKLRSAEFTKKIVQEPIRVAAEVAWQTRNYSEVRRLYESIEADLTTTEKVKLKYSRDH